MAAKGLVNFGAVRCGGGGAEFEIALIGIFIAAGVKPGIQIRVSDGFFGFMCDHVAHAIRAAYAHGGAVGPGGLDFASAGALVNIADEGIFNVRAANGCVGVESAVGPAKSRALLYVR